MDGTFQLVSQLRLAEGFLEPQSTWASQRVKTVTIHFRALEKRFIFSHFNLVLIVFALPSGKVYVSHIVDYLRHTTSRTTEDSGLEELCNMLDPEHKDVSIDLDTYHAVMREWIDDCRNNGY